MSDVLVLITATINSGQTPGVKRNDPEQRRQDYLRIFREWISLNCGADILFCENSNADLSSFRELTVYKKNKAKIRLISFPGNDGARHKGKGYGEMEIIRYVFDKVPDLKNYRYIVNVSGRYQIKNAVDLLGRIRNMSADLICDIHANLTYGDTRTVAFKPEVALAHLIPYQEEADENHGLVIEHVMARCLHRTLLGGGSWAPLPCTPYCDGVSGTWNTPERDTLLYRLKQDIKRRIARWIYRY
jgi:hypothetical protein